MRDARFTRFLGFDGSRSWCVPPILLLTSTNRQPRGNPGARKATGLRGVAPYGSRATESKGNAMRSLRKLVGAGFGAILVTALVVLANPSAAGAADSGVEAQFVAQV